MKNIGILGIGAIGSLLTKYLIQNQSNNYFLYNRSQKDRIRIEFQNHNTDFPIELTNYYSQKLDWLLVCLKEYHFQKAIPILTKLIGPHTKVAIFQNGVNLSDRYRRFTDPSNLLETIIDCPIQRIDKDAYKQFTIPKIILPIHDNSNRFIELFKESGIQLIKSSNFTEHQWTKLIESSSIGSIQAVNEMPCSIFQNEDKIMEFQNLVSEGIEVANSEGIKLNHNLNQQLLTKLKKYPRTKGSSMLSDKLSGKKLEIDAKIGIIINIAKRNKINVPTSLKVYNSLVN